MFLFSLALLVLACIPSDVTCSDEPHLMHNKPNCLASCHGEGGYCGGFCGLGGFCCRKGHGSCLERYEKVATDDYHSCISVNVTDHHRKSVLSSMLESRNKAYDYVEISLFSISNVKTTPMSFPSSFLTLLPTYVS